jgi:hypothetical protein
MNTFWRLCALLALGGCSVHPLPDEVTRQSTLGIVTAIRCEARSAVASHANSSLYDEGVIGYIFDFNILEHNNASVDVGFKRLFGGGDFDLSLTGTQGDLKRQAQRRFTIIDTFKELRLADCSQEYARTRFKYPIAGSIGLDEVIGTFMGIDRLDHARLGELDQKIGGHAAAFSDELTYTTLLDTGSLNPKLTLNPVPGAFTLTNLSVTAKTERTDTHKVIIALALPEPKQGNPKHRVRAAARAATRMMPFVRGVPSKVAIYAEPDPRARVLLELDRRVLLSKALVIAP